MKVLAIDYGRRKVGLAISEDGLVKPLSVIRYTDIEVLKKKLEKTVSENKIDKIIVGVSEGFMANESEEFAKNSGAITFDETLSTYDAQILSREAGIKRKKRKKLEDAYAAAVILRNYLDTCF
ncbi:RuvX/YqgF family protein [Patescibacteria group bacterium]